MIFAERLRVREGIEPSAFFVLVQNQARIPQSARAAAVWRVGITPPWPGAGGHPVSSPDYF